MMKKNQPENEIPSTNEETTVAFENGKKAPDRSGKKEEEGNSPEASESASNSKRKALGLFLVITGLGMLGVISFFLWGKLFASQPVSEILPAEKTLVFMEIDIDPNSNQVQKYFQLFQKHPALNQDGMKNFLQKDTSVRYENLQPWLGKKAAVALLEDPEKEGTLNPMLFLETKDKEKALQFFSNYQPKEEKKVPRNENPAENSGKTEIQVPNDSNPAANPSADANQNEIIPTNNSTPTDNDNPPSQNDPTPVVNPVEGNNDGNGAPQTRPETRLIPGARAEVVTSPETSTLTSQSGMELPPEPEISQQNLVSEDYKGTSLYSHKNGFSFFFLNDFVVLSGNKTLLKMLVNQQTSSSTALSSDQNYQKIVQNIPRNGLAFVYTNAPKFYAVALKNPAFKNDQGKIIAAMQPFLNIFAAEGTTFLIENNQLRAQTYNVIDRNQMNGATYLTFSEKYRGKLLDYAGESPVMLAGGHDLEKEIRRIEEIFKAGTKSSSIIFEGFLKANKNKYFGEDISLEKDIYPILKNEYLFSIDQSLKDPKITFLLELRDENQDKAKIEKLIQAFSSMGGMFEPKTQEVTLPDGTKGQEVVAGSEKIIREEKKHNGVNVVSLKISEGKTVISYAFTSKIFAMTTDEESLKSVIDRSMGDSKNSLKNTNLYRDHLQSLVRTSDEIFHFKVGALSEFLETDKNEFLKPYLDPFLSLNFGKNFFDDGISTMYSVEVL